MAAGERESASGTASTEQPVRAAEVVAALSLATDLGTGQPLEHALRTAVLAVRLGELAGASAQELADTYYVALLHSSGCTSDGHEAAQLYGDDIVPEGRVRARRRGRPGGGRLRSSRRTSASAAPRSSGGDGRGGVAHALPPARQTFATHCEVAQRFAGWLGLGAGTQAALGHVFERWDGLGFPGVASGDAIPLPMRVLTSRETLRLPLRGRPGRGARRRRAASGHRLRAATCRARRAESRRHARRAGRDADVGAGARARAARRRSGSPATGSTPRSRRSPRSPTSSRRGCASTRRAWPSSRRPPPGGSGCRRPP